MVAYHEGLAALPPMRHEALSLAHSGFEVNLLCLVAASAPTSSAVEVPAPGFTIRPMHLRTRSFFHSVYGRGRAQRAIGAVQHALSYGEFLARALAGALSSRADVFEAHDLPALLPAVLAAKLRGRPVVYRAHELWSESHAKVRFAAFWRRLDRVLVPRCDAVVTPDETRSLIYRDEFRARAAPLTVRNCPPFRPPLESTLLRDELARRGITCSTIILYQGLIDSMRCIEELAEASRQFDDGVVLVIVGRGFTDKWRDAAATLAGYDRIVVLPPVDATKLAPFTASADAGLLFYRNDCRNNYLCAPNKVFEYMMMGLPVIAANHPGLRKLVEGEDVGLCVDPEDPAAIAAAVNHLARDAAARARMKANGLRLSRERYHWETEFRPLLERYRTLVAGEPSARLAT